MDGHEIDKGRVLDALRQQVAAGLEALTRSQQASREGATHEESRPENPKDTRALEAQYLARGLADRVVELENARSVLASLRLESFDDGGVVRPTALVSLALEHAEASSAHYFVTPVAGGVRVVVDGLEITTVTPATPLGRALIGREVGDEVVIHTPRQQRTARVRSIR